MQGLVIVCTNVHIELNCMRQFSDHSKSNALFRSCCDSVTIRMRNVPIDLFSVFCTLQYSVVVTDDCQFVERSKFKHPWESHAHGAYWGSRFAEPRQIKK